MTVSQTLIIADGVLLEEVGDDFLVLVPGHTSCVTLTGDKALFMRNLRAGVESDSPQPALSELIDLGVLSRSNMPTRRGLLVAGAMGLGAGITLLAMPSAAIASSPIGCQPGAPLNGYYFGGANNSSTFCVSSITDGQNDEQIGTLSVYAKGQRYDSITSIGGPSGISWSISDGFAATDIGSICGNVTIDGVFYQVNFVFNGE